MKLSLPAPSLEKIRALGSGVRRHVIPNLYRAKDFLSINLLDGFLYPKKSVVISLEQSLVNVVVATLFLSKIRILSNRTYTFDDGRFPQPDNLASTISLALDEAKARKIPIIVSLPKEWMVTRRAELPVAVKDNLTDVIRYELDRFTPFSYDEAVYDFKAFAEKDEKLVISLSAARQLQVSPYLASLAEKGVKVKRVTSQTSGLATLCRYMNDGKDGVYLSVSNDEYVGFATVRGVAISPFVIDVGSGELEGNSDLLVDELLPLVEEMRIFGMEPALMVIAEEPLEALLDGKLDVPVKRITAGEIVEKLKATGQDLHLATSGAVVEDLWFGSKGIDLLAKGGASKNRMPVFVTILLALVIVGFLVPYAMLPLEREKRRLAEIERQISIRREEVKKVEALKKEIDVVEAEIKEIGDFKDARPMVLNIMKELTVILPKTSWTTRVRIAEEKIEVEGYAQSATEILPKLEQSKFFKKVEFSSPTIRDTRMNADRFVIKMELEGYEKMEVDKKEPGAKVPDKKESGKKEPGVQAPAKKEPEKKAAGVQTPEKKEAVQKEPEKRTPEKKAPEKREPEKTKNEKK